MASNPFTTYYINQAGSGIAGYSGVRYQKGHGFFGRLLSGAVMPILKYLGRKALNTGVNIGTDLLQGDNFKSTMKKRLKNTGLDIAEDTLEKVRNFRQSGSGRRRRKANKKTSKKRKLSLLQLQALAEGRKSLKKKRSIKRRKKSESILF